MKSEFLRAARLQRVCGTIFFLGLLLLLFQHTAEATTWTVTSTEDRSYDPPEGTLRHAVQNAWNNDIIVFASSGMEIQLAEELPIGKNVTIMGSSTTVRQTAPHHRVFSVASGAFVRMEHLTITGGKGYSGGAGGGGILNRGYLTLYRCTLRDNYASTYGGSIENYGDLTLNIVTLENNTAAHQGGGICNRMGGTLNAYTSTIRNNTSEGYGGGLTNFGTANLLSHTDFSGNTANRGGGIYNDGEITTSWCTLSSNQASESSAGGGIENYGSLTLAENSAVTGNTPLEILGNYTTDGTCTIGTSPGRSSVALAGMASGSSPKARSTAGEPDVIAAEENLGNSGSSLYGEVKEALSGDLRGISGNLSASLEEMDATLYNAFTYENVPLADTSGEGELEIEFTASWPRCVRYYAAFALAEEDAANDESAKTLVPGSYVLPERGIQFEIQPGQNLPEGVTPPEFYESGEGLRTWRNTVADNGSFDLNPETGTVTFRICSVRAEAQAPASGGSSGGCNAGGDGASWLSFLLLLGLPLMGGLRKKYEKSSETKREGEICMCEKRGKRTCSFLILSVLMFLEFFIFQDAAHATTWIVTSEADDEARETLRHAVENAAGGDTVSIRVPVVNLRSFLFVNKNLTISGYPSATLRQTVAGERVAYFIPGITCTLNGLTITGGDLSGSSLCGAGLINHGTLTMKDCIVTNNTEGGGILNAGNLTMHDCTVSNNTANWPR
ncbi:MAG TPA: hypothetical protein PLW97_12070, partial [Synergistaceae bacterium]|nr:hypothetical protein [Synergistaceae bacterium]